MQGAKEPYSIQEVRKTHKVRKASETYKIHGYNSRSNCCGGEAPTGYTAVSCAGCSREAAFLSNNSENNNPCYNPWVITHAGVGFGVTHISLINPNTITGSLRQTWMELVFGLLLVPYLVQTDFFMSPQEKSHNTGQWSLQFHTT